MRLLRDCEQPLALRLGIVAAAVILMFGLPAVAQEEPAPAAEPTEEEAIEQAIQKSFEEEITVTGSLIPRPTLESMSPVTVMEPEEIVYSGVTRIEDLVRQLPQVFSRQNSTVANSSSGTASVDLRNMGAERTLVLINGRRMVPGDAYEVSPDLNFIPPALIKRIDVLTGGAASVYGPDAVTGVVNFVLDTDFEGVRGGVSWAGYQHDNNNAMAQEMNAARGFPYPTGSTLDGNQYNVNLALGHKFGEGRGHAALYVDYRKADELLKSERDYLACAPGLGDEGPVCSGSSTAAAGRFMSYRADGSSNGSWTLDETTGNTFRPYVGTTDAFNYGPYNHMQRPDEKWAAGGFMNYKFNDSVDVYAEVMFMDDYTEAQIAPSGSFLGSGVMQINCDNPMMSEQQRDILCTQAGYGPTDYATVIVGRRSVESGGRVNVFRHTSWRLVAGVRGDLSDAWSYDFYALTAETSAPQEYQGDFDSRRLANATDIIVDPEDPSSWVCRSGSDDGCVPWNIFSAGGVTQEALDYLVIDLSQNTGTKTQIINGIVNGDLGEYGLKLPTATEGIQVALGAGHRYESLFVHLDENWEEGWASGQGGPTPRVDGDYYLNELYAEALVPIVQDATGFKDLSLELGYRYTDYSTSGGADNWKMQAAWAPMDLFKFRIGLARATRAANVQELFSPQSLGLAGSADPCAGSDPTYTVEQCMNTGMTAAQYGNVEENPADQYNSLDGGNPDLLPETADTFTAGLVITPPSVSGLSFAIDYYDIVIEDTIDSMDPDTTIVACATGGDPYLCSLIHRDQYGTLWLTNDGYTEATEQNLGKVYGEGIDFNYAWLIGIGDAGYLNTSLIGTYMLADRLQTPVVDYDCVGYFGAQCAPYPTPEWQHRARISWETSFNMVFSLAWRYTDAVVIDDASPDPDLADPSAIELWKINDGYENPAFNYFDLAWTWDFADHYQVVLGCDNIFDEEPPLGADQNDNDYGPGFFGFYDPYGRSLHAAIHFDF
jgi:outer membrane receptor protein involved in Fe transport